MRNSASIGRDKNGHENLGRHFVLALITIAFEIYSDAALTSAEVSHTVVPDPATAALPTRSSAVWRPHRRGECLAVNLARDVEVA